MPWEFHSVDNWNQGSCDFCEQPTAGWLRVFRRYPAEGTGSTPVVYQVCVVHLAMRGHRHNGFLLTEAVYPVWVPPKKPDTSDIDTAGP